MCVLCTLRVRVLIYTHILNTHAHIRRFTIVEYRGGKEMLKDTEATVEVVDVYN